MSSTSFPPDASNVVHGVFPGQARLVDGKDGASERHDAPRAQAAVAASDAATGTASQQGGFPAEAPREAQARFQFIAREGEPARASEETATRDEGARGEHFPFPTQAAERAHAREDATAEPGLPATDAPQEEAPHAAGELANAAEGSDDAREAPGLAVPDAAASPAESPAESPGASPAASPAASAADDTAEGMGSTPAGGSEAAYATDLSLPGAAPMAPRPLTRAIDAAARLAADANAAAEALDSLKRLLQQGLPAAGQARIPHPLAAAEERRNEPAPLPPRLPPRPPATDEGQIAAAPLPPQMALAAPLPPTDGARFDVRGFLAGFALSWAIGVVLYLFMMAG